METFFHYSWMALGWLILMVCFGVGLAGCIIPLLPGHILILAGTVFARLFLPGIEFAWYHWINLALICVLGMFGDNVFSLWGAKRFGSTKAGLLGCAAGIVVGLFFGPWGLLAGPFVGALAAELIVSRNSFSTSLKSGTGAFLGTLAGMVFKILTGLAMVGYSLLLFLMP